MKKIAALFLIFSQLAMASNYPIPAPGSTGNVLTASSGKWVSGSPASGGGGTQYITGQDSTFDSTIGNWTAYADAAGTQPVDATGGSPSVTCTQSTSSPLHGAGSMLITKGASNRQGDGCSVPVTIAAEHSAGTTIYVDVDYSVSSGTYATDDLSWWAYDVTGTIMYPLAVKSTGTASGMATCASGSYCHMTGYFTTSSGNTSYRLAAHVATTSASAYTIKADDIRFAVRDTVAGSVITDWAAWTPTGSWSTNTTYSGKKRRNGQFGEYEVNIALAGAPTSAALTVNMPSGEVIDTAAYPVAPTSGFTIVDSSGSAIDSATDVYQIFAFYNSTTSISVTPGNASSTYLFTGAVTQAVPFTFGNADSVVIRWKVPVVGFSSNVQMASSTNKGTTLSSVTTSSHTGGFSANTTGTYTTPAGVVQIEVCGVGAGGGGGPSGSAGGGSATAGTATTFGTSLISLPGGSAGARNADGGAGGGAPTINAPAVAGITAAGGQGGGAVSQGASPVTAIQGGIGGFSFLGGAGAAGVGGGGGTLAGLNAAANSGAGGGGAGGGTTSSVTAGSGGGGGTWACATIVSPLASYSYTVGAKGTGGTLGTSGAKGGDGADGQLVIKESYVPNGTIGIDQEKIVSVSGNYTVQVTDRSVVNTSSGTMSLVSAAQVTGRIFRFKSSGASVNTTLTPPSGTICGRSSVILSGDEAGDYQSDGTNYQGLGDSCKFTGYVAVETTCTTGTCTITRQSGNWLASIVHNSTGNYTITFGTGVFGVAPVCSFTGMQVAPGDMCEWTSYPTTTSGVAVCYNNATTLQDTRLQMSCVGYR